MGARRGRTGEPVRRSRSIDGWDVGVGRARGVAVARCDGRAAHRGDERVRRMGGHPWPPGNALRRAAARRHQRPRIRLLHEGHPRPESPAHAAGAHFRNPPPEGPARREPTRRAARPRTAPLDDAARWRLRLARNHPGHSVGDGAAAHHRRDPVELVRRARCRDPGLVPPGAAARRPRLGDRRRLRLGNRFHARSASGRPRRPAFADSAERVRATASKS